MALTANQQTEFDKVKETISRLEEEIGQSLNLQANGGYYVRNELIALKDQLKRVEEA